MSAQLTVHVAGDERSVAAGTTAGELFDGQRDVLVARINGGLCDLDHVLGGGDTVEPVTAAEQDGLDVLRHSCAHVLAQAVQQVHPDARLGIGPPIPWYPGHPGTSRISYGNLYASTWMDCRRDNPYILIFVYE